MIKIKNVNNGETMQVWQTGIDKATGRIYCNGTPTAKYLAKYPLLVTGEKIGEDSVLILEDGWVIVKGRQANRQPTSPRRRQPLTKHRRPQVTKTTYQRKRKQPTTAAKLHPLTLHPQPLKATRKQATQHRRKKATITA